MRNNISKHEAFPFKLSKKFVNKIKYWGNYFRVSDSITFSEKFTIKANQTKNNEIEIKLFIQWIELETLLLEKKFLKIKNPDNIIVVWEKVFNFNNQQKGKGLKILIPKQMLQTLPIALTQIKVGNIS